MIGTESAPKMTTQGVSCPGLNRLLKFLHRTKPRLHAFLQDASIAHQVCAFRSLVIIGAAGDLRLRKSEALQLTSAFCEALLNRVSVSVFRVLNRPNQKRGEKGTSGGPSFRKLNRGPYIIHLNIATCEWWCPLILVEKATCLKWAKCTYLLSSPAKVTPAKSLTFTRLELGPRQKTYVCLVSGKQRDPKKAKKQRGAISGEV